MRFKSNLEFRYQIQFQANLDIIYSPLHRDWLRNSESISLFFGVVVFAIATTAAADGVVVDDHDYGDALQQMPLFFT